MTYQHRELAAGRWYELSFFEQMGNVGAEIGRTIAWKDRNPDFSRRAFERALELLDLTISDIKNRKRLKELLRVREALADYFAFDNSYQSSNESWERYFYPFQYAARADRQEDRRNRGVEPTHPTGVGGGDDSLKHSKSP